MTFQPFSHLIFMIIYDFTDFSCWYYYLCIYYIKFFVWKGSLVEFRGKDGIPANFTQVYIGVEVPKDSLDNFQFVFRIIRQSKFHFSAFPPLDIHSFFFSKLLKIHFRPILCKMTYYNVFLKMIFIIGMNYFYRFIKNF